MLLTTEGITAYTIDKEFGQQEDLGKSLPSVESLAFEEGKKRVYFSTIFKNRRKGGSFSMFITAPIHDYDGRLIGVVALEVDITPLYELIQDTRGLGHTGETFIGMQIGNKALFLNPLRHDPDATLKRVVTFVKKKHYLSRRLYKEEMVPAFLSTTGARKSLLPGVISPLSTMDLLLKLIRGRLLHQSAN